MDRCKLTLAGGVIEPKVRFLTLARLSALGHMQPVVTVNIVAN